LGQLGDATGQQRGDQHKPQFLPVPHEISFAFVVQPLVPQAGNFLALEFRVKRIKSPFKGPLVFPVQLFKLPGIVKVRADRVLHKMDDV
jgi:hypothetical protein